MSASLMTGKDDGRAAASDDGDIVKGIGQVNGPHTVCYFTKMYS